MLPVDFVEPWCSGYMPVNVIKPGEQNQEDFVTSQSSEQSVNSSKEIGTVIEYTVRFYRED